MQASSGPHGMSGLPDVVLDGQQQAGAALADILHDALRSIRVHLGMDVAFVSEFAGGRRWFRYVDAAGDHPPVVAGASDPLEASYCSYVVDGRLPQLIHDAALIPLALTLPVTTALPVGAHMSVPIHLSDGRVYGTFCCFSAASDHTLGDRDLALLQMFAEFAGRQLDRELAASRVRDEMAERVELAIAARDFAIVYQPIHDLADDRIVGFEALTRFNGTPFRPPTIWFDEATRVGRVAALDTAVIAKALESLERLPRQTYLTLNVSPETLASGVVTSALERAPHERIVLEITEHASIADYERLGRELGPLRAKGVRIAVDDAGAGYASLRHILRLLPELIKLDISLTQGIDTDRSRRALAAALARFAEETGSAIIAEGVETAAELAVLRSLNIDNAQGYLIGRPMPLSEAVALAEAAEGRGTTAREIGAAKPVLPPRRD